MQEIQDNPEQNDVNIKLGQLKSSCKRKKTKRRKAKRKYDSDENNLPSDTFPKQYHCQSATDIGISASDGLPPRVLSDEYPRMRYRRKRGEVKNMVHW